MFTQAVIEIGPNLTQALAIIAIAAAAAYGLPRMFSTAAKYNQGFGPWDFIGQRAPLSLGPIGTLTLSRGTLADYTRREHNSGVSLDYDGALAESISRRFEEAREAGAIEGPSDVEAVVNATGGALIIAVRERHTDPGSYAFQRQISSGAIAASALLARDTAGEEGAFAALEACLARATSLLPALALLQAAEGLDEGRSTRNA
jgi:hypothetical protein